MDKKIGNVFFNSIPHRVFRYRNAIDFMDEMDEISKEADAKNVEKITIKFFSKDGSRVILNYYSILEFLLFTNGLRLVKII